MLQHSCGCTQCEQASRALKAQATSHTDGYSRQPYMYSLFDCSSRKFFDQHFACTSGLQLQLHILLWASRQRWHHPIYSMTWGWSKSTAEPLLGLEDGHKAQPGKQKAEQHSCAAAAQLVAHVEPLERALLAKTEQIATYILEAAKTSVKLSHVDSTITHWYAVVPAERGHGVLKAEVHAHVKQLCEGSGMKNVYLRYDLLENKWHLKFATAKAVAEAFVTGQ